MLDLSEGSLRKSDIFLTHPFFHPFRLEVIFVAKGSHFSLKSLNFVIKYFKAIRKKLSEFDFLSRRLRLGEYVSRGFAWYSYYRWHKSHLQLVCEKYLESCEKVLQKAQTLI